MSLRHKSSREFSPLSAAPTTFPDEARRSDIIQFPPTLKALFNSVAAILRIAEEHLRAGHVEHWVRDIRY
jgi:hypothetical protein